MLHKYYCLYFNFFANIQNIILNSKKVKNFFLKIFVEEVGLEPTRTKFRVSYTPRSILLFEQVNGIEPSSSAWRICRVTTSISNFYHMLIRPSGLFCMKADALTVVLHLQIKIMSPHTVSWNYCFD